MYTCRTILKSNLPCFSDGYYDQQGVSTIVTNIKWAYVKRHFRTTHRHPLFIKTHKYDTPFMFVFQCSSSIELC